MPPKKNNRLFRKTGFGLIELLAVLGVLAVLAALAFSSYQESVRRVKRFEAWAAMMKIMQHQERHYSVHGSYAAFSASNSQGFAWYSGGAPASSAYEISAAACDGYSIKQCVVLTAEPGTDRVQRGYTDPYCGKLALNSAGVRVASSGDSSC